MYSREFKEAPKVIVKNGKADFGTYSGVSPKIEIRGMRTPYAGVPLPSFLTNLRIKSRLNYIFNLDNYIGMANIFDFKIFGLAEVIFWNKTTGKKNAYHTIMPTRWRFVPTTTGKGLFASYKKSRKIKISWGRRHEHHSLRFHLKGDNVRPTAEGFIFSPIKDSFHNDNLFVCPSPVSSRCCATWVNSMSIHGNLNLNKETVDNSNGYGAMILNRSYYKTLTKSIMIYAVGNNKDHNILFNIKSSNLDAADSEKYNENVLIVDNQSTALPPVYCTHPFGTEKKWIIQDTNSMIDLSFTPVSLDTRELNLIVFRNETLSIYGTFDGVLLTKEGEKITLKNFPGIVYSSLVRI